jgi:hypothetical protein
MGMISQVPDDFESLITRDREKDSLNFWFKNPPKDSLQFRYPYKDSLRTHTVKYSTPTPDSLVVKKTSPKVLHLMDSVLLTANLPIIKMDNSKIQVRNKDSVFVAFQVNLHPNKD